MSVAKTLARGAILSGLALATLPVHAANAPLSVETAELCTAAADRA